MTYPNAHAGVKKVYSAHILYLIAVVLILAGVIWFAFSAKMITSEGVDLSALEALQDDPQNALNVVGPTAVPMLAGIVILIVAFIMHLVGLSKAGKDEGAFKAAFWVMIVWLILSVVLAFIFPANSEGASAQSLSINIGVGTSSVSSVVGLIACFIAMLLTVKGVMNLAGKLNRADMISRGKTLTLLLVIEFVLNAVVSVFGFLNTSDAVTAVVGYVSYASTLFAIIVFFVMLGYLGSAKKMLAAA